MHTLAGKGICFDFVRFFDFLQVKQIIFECATQRMNFVSNSQNLGFSLLSYLFLKSNMLVLFLFLRKFISYFRWIVRF